MIESNRNRKTPACASQMRPHRDAVEVDKERSSLPSKVVRRGASAATVGIEACQFFRS